MAYTWFGLQRDARGLKHAQKLLNSTEQEKQAAGHFVLSRLGNKTILEPVTKLLNAGAPANMRDSLLISLSEITTPEDFKKRAPASLTWSSGYKEGLIYSQFKAAVADKKSHYILQMLRSRTPGHRKLAVNYLLENGYARELRPFAAVSLEAPGLAAIIRNDIRRAGWKIIDTDEIFEIVPASPNPENIKLQ
jgi:hypothetical protein